MNHFGSLFRISLFGESHGRGVGVVIDGLKPGIALSEELFAEDLALRRGGERGTTPRREEDRVEVLSGLYRGHTTGAPLTLWFENREQRSEEYLKTVGHYRPSHADFTASVRYRGWNDPRGGGHFSGRLTLPLVAAGVVAKAQLEGVTFSTHIVELGGEQNPERFDALLDEAHEAGDSLGGVVECVVEGIPTGWGEPLIDSLEGLIAHLIFAIPGVRGVEFGAGFTAARMRGSEHNDLLLNGRGETLTNHAGGVVGGLTNGNPLVVRVAFKPTPSIAREQLTYEAQSDQRKPLMIHGRHDTAIVLRGRVVVEAAVAIVLADMQLQARARE